MRQFLAVAACALRSAFSNARRRISSLASGERRKRCAGIHISPPSHVREMISSGEKPP